MAFRSSSVRSPVTVAILTTLIVLAAAVAVWAYLRHGRPARPPGAAAEENRMTRAALVSLSSFALLSAGGPTAQAAPRGPAIAEAADLPTGRAVIEDREGRRVGEATLVQTPRLLDAKRPHAGDLPNLHVPSSGELDVEVLAPAVKLRGRKGLLDRDGAALVVHAGPDDYHSEPAGDAGGRIACGVVTR